jgi:CTP:molybdopterin cytidylyltransferase MocA
VRGLLLAAGAGRRMGRPKALLRDAAGTPYVVRAVRVLREGGLAEVTVVVGAAAEEVRPLLDPLDVEVVLAADWAEGMGASLRAGLADAGIRDAGTRDTDATRDAGTRDAGTRDTGTRDAGTTRDADALVVHLVDLPDVGAPVVRRLLAQAPPAPATLARASYDGRPGHPVLVGRDHWAGIATSARDDRGAREYLRAHPHQLVECGDLATGRDVDIPAEL